MLKFLATPLLTALLCSSAVAADVTYRKDIFPIWDAQCSACHGAQSPYLGEFLANDKKFIKEMKGPRMDTYADLIFYVGWPDTGALMRRLDDGANTANKKPGNMYEYLGDTDAERQANYKIFRAWIGEGGWTHKRWEARGSVPGISREELEKILVKY